MRLYDQLLCVFFSWLACTMLIKNELLFIICPDDCNTSFVLTVNLSWHESRDLWSFPFFSPVVDCFSVAMRAGMVERLKFSFFYFSMVTPICLTEKSFIFLSFIFLLFFFYTQRMCRDIISVLVLFSQQMARRGWFILFSIEGYSSEHNKRT